MEDQYLRVLSIIHGPRWGGIHQIAEGICGRLIDGSVKMHVVVSNRLPEADSKRLVVSGAVVHTVSLGRIRKSRNPLLHLRYAAGLTRDVYSLAQLIRQQSIGIVQVNGMHHVAGALAGFFTRTPIVWQLHSDQQPRWLIYALSPIIRLLSAEVMFSGAGLERKLFPRIRSRRGGSAFSAGVDVNAFFPSCTLRRSARAFLRVSEKDFVIGTIGGRGPNKNHGMLIDLLDCLENQRVRVVVRIIGPAQPDHVEWYQKNVIGKAVHKGYIDDGRVAFFDKVDNVAEVMNGFDVFCLPSKGEGASLVISEAMACGVPVVANDVGAVADSVIEGHTGFLNRSCSLEEMARHVQVLMQNEQLRRVMGQSGRAFVAQHRSIEACANVHLRVYRAVSGNRSDGLPC